MSDGVLMSRPYKDTGLTCEACVFGRGEHAEFCEFTPKQARTVKTYIDKVGGVWELHKGCADPWERVIG